MKINNTHVLKIVSLIARVEGDCLLITHGQWETSQSSFVFLKT